MPSSPVLVAVMGPTASGKTRIAESLADELDAQLINADAFQVYRGMDIGTAKPADKSRYLLLDSKDPDEGYGVGEFCVLAQRELERLFEEGRNAIVVGGTGLYIRALFEEYAGLRPEPDSNLRATLRARLAEQGLHALVTQLRAYSQTAPQRIDIEKIDLKNPVRVLRALELALEQSTAISVRLPAFQRIKLGLSAEVAIVNRRINERTNAMVQNGWVQEVRRLLGQGYGPGNPGFRAIGYTELAGAIEGGTDLEEAIATTIAETRRYAKRQRTWLRSEPGLIVIDPSDRDVVKGAMSQIRSVML